MYAKIYVKNVDDRYREEQRQHDKPYLSHADKGNYTACTMKMQVYMHAYEVWDAIDSKGSKTTVENKVDKIALVAIYQSIDDILLTLVEKKTKEAWKALKTMC